MTPMDVSLIACPPDGDDGASERLLSDPASTAEESTDYREEMAQGGERSAREEVTSRK